MTYDFLIVGAGLAGCVFAHEARRAGKTCLLVEQRKEIGGNLRQDEIEGIRVHKYGAHIFRTNDDDVWEFVNRFASFNNFVNSPIANYNGEIFNLPFNMNTFNRLWGCRTPNEAKECIEKNSVPCKNPQNLEEWAKSLVGVEIYTKLIKDYTEKQWGRKCSELPISIMRRIPLRFTYDNNYFNSKYQGVPIGGYNAILEKMTDGCDIVTGKSYKECKKSVSAKKIVYTGALDELYDYKLGCLEWRGLRFETEVIDEDNYQGVAVQNFTGKEPYTRIIEHKHFEFGKQPKTVITKEYPVQWEVGKEKYYPINDAKNDELQKQYLELAKKDGIVPLGRLAEYQYYDMQDTIKRAIDVSVKVLGSEMNGE